MKNHDGTLVLGRTRWRRFALAAVPAVVAVGAIMFAMANGALAAHFSVSGQSFKVSADQLEGTDFVQYGMVDQAGDETLIPVAKTEIGTAELTNLCQSVDATNPLLPFDSIVLRIEAGGGGTPAAAENLVIGLQELEGDATFSNIQIGRDAGDLGSSPGGLPGEFGQSADAISISDLRQTASSTSAGTFTLNGLSLRVLVNSDLPNNGECF